MIEKTKIKALIKVVFNFDVNDEIGLLRAYFTCEAIKSQPDFGDDIEQAYKRAKKECTVIEKKAFAYIVPPRRWDKLNMLCRCFSEIKHPGKFIQIFTPNLICDQRKLIHFHTDSGLSWLTITYVISLLRTVHSETSPQRYKTTEDIYKAVINSFSKANVDNLKISNDLIVDCYNAVCLTELNDEGISKIQSATEIVNICVKHHIPKEAIPELILHARNNDKIQKVAQTYKIGQADMWVCRSKLLAMENNNLALLCAASYGHESDDVNLENCFLYPRFFASFSSKEKPTVIIVSPSDIFIRKLLFDSAFRNVNFLIVINSKTKCKIYHQYLNDTTYFGSGEIKFYTFEEFCSNQKTTIDSVLLFATRIADTDQENLICALAEICDSNTQIYSFHESDEFEKASGYISKYIASGKVLLQEIDILPQNLLFAKGKKKKISCKWNIVNESLQDPSDYPVCLNKYNLICDDFQFLSKFSLELFTNKRAIWEEGNSIRKAYRNLMYTNKSGQTRMPAKKYRFSPEISVFYTVDNFKSDGSFRLRCHLKKHSLTKRTGIVIEESKRNYRHILPFQIPDIIENDYLFSTKNRTLIRDIYKDNFYDFANAEKLSLRSFFYLFFPWSEWKEDDNKNFELVKNILNTELGEFDIVSSSAKKYEEAYYDFELMNMNIEFEEYIAGVVTAESSDTRFPEAMKAQAVAARNYALYQTNNWYN